MFRRSLAWIKSLRKLDAAVDFQGIVACNRFLLEAIVDIILLHGDSGNGACEMMSSWEQSAQLKHAQAVLSYYAGMQLPNQFQPLAEFVSKKGGEVAKRRKDLWNGKHPNRWTGENLDAMVKRADLIVPEVTKDVLGQTLTEFYETQYRKMNWYVHGSALAGIRTLNSNAFDMICFFGYRWSADLALLGTRIVMVDLGFASHLPSFGARLNELKELRLLAFGDAIDFKDSDLLPEPMTQ